MAKHTIPVKRNDQVELDIHGLGHGGEGVGRYKDFTLFVPDALPGERVRVKVERVKKTYGNASLLEVLQPGPARKKPLCPIFRRCGGCQLQHLSYEEQLKEKRQRVVDNLERIGKISHVTVHPTIGMENPWRYRNKAQVPIGEREGALIGGFYASGTHEIIDMDACLIQHEHNDETVNQVKRLAAMLGISPYNERTHTGHLRHIVVRTGYNTGDIMVILITKNPTLPKRDELVRAIREQVPRVKSIVQNVNPKRTNVIFGEQTKTLWGDDVIYDTIGSIRFAISPRSFYQVNPVQTEKLYNKALAYANLSGKETVIDAYCGIGTISLFMAQKAKRVYGVEIVSEAIRDAEFNARLNQIENVEFQTGKAEEVIPQWYEKGIRADVLVVDPPRKGCDEQLLETIVKMRPKRVVYVSCNPSTLARDLRFLEDGGYRTLEVQPVDMFPHTMHVECIVSTHYTG